VESEANKGSEVMKEKFGSIKEKMSEVFEEAGKSDFAKKAGETRHCFTHCVPEPTARFMLVHSEC
jgi:hypothetical protein